MARKPKTNGQGLTFAQWQEIALGRKPTEDDSWGATYAVLYTAWQSNESAGAWYVKLGGK